VDDKPRSNLTSPNPRPPPAPSRDALAPPRPSPRRLHHLGHPPSSPSAAGRGPPTAWGRLPPRSSPSLRRPPASRGSEPPAPIAASQLPARR